jgi:SpoVK/Ycf46/Vps4 family AAA+-type ATPase
VEKAFAGASGGTQDGGVSTNLFGQWLTWMNDHVEDVFLICTANNLAAILDHNPEFARQGRFDGVFFFDFPDQAALRAIWEVHLRGYGFLRPEAGLDELDQAVPDSVGFTGAEVEGVCRLARLRRRPLAEVARTIPRLAEQASAAIDRLRDWATGVAWSTEQECLYDKGLHAVLPAPGQALEAGSGRRVAARGPRKATV